MYDKISLTVDVLKLAERAANVTTNIHNANAIGYPPDDLVFELLDVSRELNSKAQCLEQLYRGHRAPVIGPRIYAERRTDGEKSRTAATWLQEQRPKSRVGHDCEDADGAGAVDCEGLLSKMIPQPHWKKIAPGEENG